MTDYYRQQLDNRPADASGHAYLAEILRWLRWIGLLTIVILAYAWIQAESLGMGYQISRFKQDNLGMEQEVSAFKVEHSLLTAPDRIARHADKMGFIRIDQGIRLVQADLPLFDPDRPMMARK